MFNQNAPTFSDHDLSIRITPIEGTNKGKPFTIRSRSKASLDDGRKRVQLFGADEGPLTVISGKAEPKIELEVSIAEEAAQADEWVGVDNRCDVVMVFARTGMPSRTWASKAGLLSGGGFDTDPDKGPGSKLTHTPSDIERNGVSIYKRSK